MRLLVAEDDRDLAEVLGVFLERNNFAVEVVGDGRAALDHGLSGVYDGIVLDVMMPAMDGIEVLRRLRDAGVGTPVMMLTAKGATRDRIAGFDAGADDYLPKPFHLAELSARIRSVLRRHRHDGRQSLDAGNVRLWPDSRRVEVAGREVELLRKEYDILHYFMSRPNHTIDKAALAEGVWGDHIDQADNFDFVYAQMKNLRRKLHDAGADIEIRAVYGFGYKLVQP